MEFLSLKDQSLEEIQISEPKKVKKLDACKNKITSLQGLEKCYNLTNINLAFNHISSLIPVGQLKQLVVLNLSNNALKTMLGLGQLPSLCALILNNNQIEVISNLQGCPKLNTLVLSHNRLQQVENISHLKELKKLSLSHNQIKSLDGLTCQSLEEVRANGNQISRIPAHFGNLQRLKILDIGNNKIQDPKSFDHLRDLKLIQLNLSNNPCSDAAEARVKDFPRLRNVINKKQAAQPRVALYEPEFENAVEGSKAPTIKSKRSAVTKVEKPKEVTKKLKKLKKADLRILGKQERVEKWN